MIEIFSRKTGNRRYSFCFFHAKGELSLESVTWKICLEIRGSSAIGSVIVTLSTYITKKFYCPWKKQRI
ncbi:hypothetical protein GS511_17005 [Leptospira borgpetersenii]|nr:hypothetical protein IQ66_19755 [Leptospira borgpetersenii serovar Ballum]QHE28693.1 hypothetical protein GS524_17010 [Leptospira borgpetersenii]OOV42228.1 hypothetical protein B1H38_16105 [Leptospira borgpetersenii serovar Ballum]QHE31995.1 hypothetical protein GS523_17005 [Leptospira borgpetersenii]QHE35294.1 hypothetical protein GS517_17005 [Leptospira borgpetersenii]